VRRRDARSILARRDGAHLAGSAGAGGAGEERRSACRRRRQRGAQRGLPGRQARVIGLIGDDEAGGLLEESLAARGVACAFERLPDAPTITKLRVISRHQQLIRLDFEERFDARHAARVALLAAHLDGMDVLVLSDYAKGTLPTCRP
jgi:hypothetical protein